MAVTAIDLQVDDVSAAVELLLGPLTTDWGTEAAYLRGPGNLIVDLCKDSAPV